MRIGVQVSYPRGLPKAIEEAGRAGLRCLQVFSRNPVGGQSQPLPTRESIRIPLSQWSISPFFVHAPYFVNPAALDPVKQERAGIVLTQEMRRVKRLCGQYLVMHCGHASKLGLVEEGEAALVKTLTAMLRAPGRIVLENSGGQGNELGADIEGLGRILARLGRTRRVGVMLDTAHALAAGYPLSRESDFLALWALVDRHIGLDRVIGIHLNDNPFPVGSHQDRHAHLLTGSLGEGALRELLAWANRRECPLLLETPGRTVDEREDDLRIIKTLL